MKKGPESLRLKKLVALLEKTGRKRKARVWIEAARLVAKPSRKKRTITLARLSNVTKDGEAVAVISKILSDGELNRSISLGFVSASKPALKKLGKLGTEALPLEEFVAKNPEGKKIKLIT